MKTKPAFAQVTFVKTLARRWCTACNMAMLMLALTLPLPVKAQFDYRTDNGTITITGYYESVGAVTVPDTINGLPVTGIGFLAFSNLRSLTNATLPNSVTIIGDGAFYNCSGLSSIAIPNNLASIGEQAFFGCTRLTNITIPNTVTSIGAQAFAYCSSLAGATLGNSVTNVGRFAFEHCSSLGAIGVEALNSCYASVEGRKATGIQYSVRGKSVSETPRTTNLVGYVMAFDH